MGDHRGVVAGPGQGDQAQLDSALGRPGGQRTAEETVGGHASRDREEQSPICGAIPKDGTQTPAEFSDQSGCWRIVHARRVFLFPVPISQPVLR